MRFRCQPYEEIVANIPEFEASLAENGVDVVKTVPINRGKNSFAWTMLLEELPPKLKLFDDDSCITFKLSTFYCNPYLHQIAAMAEHYAFNDQLTIVAVGLSDIISTGEFDPLKLWIAFDKPQSRHTKPFAEGLVYEMGAIDLHTYSTNVKDEKFIELCRTGNFTPVLLHENYRLPEPYPSLFTPPAGPKLEPEMR